MGLPQVATMPPPWPTKRCGPWASNNRPMSGVLNAFIP